MKVQLDRSRAPRVKKLKNINIHQPETIYLDNGIPVHIVSMGTQEVVKVELCFFAGRPFEVKKLAGRATNHLLKEGSIHTDSAKVAQLVDFYGASFTTPFNMDMSNVSMLCLKKHFEPLLSLLAEILKNPVFPQEELDLFIQNNQRNLIVELKKNDTLAYRKITELVFGDANAYGWNSIAETYAALQKADILEHYKRNYVQQNCLIILSGKVDDQIIQLLNQYLSPSILEGKKALPLSVERIIQPPQQVFIENQGLLQSSISIGRRLFSRSDPHFFDFYILNTILGGYFGSRLMKNIREKKGYTYNISSGSELMLFDGYWHISCDVGNEFVKPTIKEIYKEMEKLQQQPVSQTELRMVKNYLLGVLLSTIDGPFNTAEIIKLLKVNQLEVHHFQHLIEHIMHIKAADIQAIAQQYLNKEDMFEVVVGSL